MALLNTDQIRVAIVGSGIAGISTAIALKRQLKFENFIIYEKGPDIGGTWRDNTYPGCASDVAGHWYSLSTDPNPYWSSYLVSQPEILAYWDSLASKYSLRSHTVFNTKVVSAIWSDSDQVYHLLLQDEVTRETREIDVEVLVSAVGGLMSPKYPKDIRGKENFEGIQFHSARWRHDVLLSGKRVGVIGNACSAAQIVPEISNDPSTTVVNFCRTPSWIVPRVTIVYPPWVKWAFANVPFILRMYRAYVSVSYELRFINFIKSSVKSRAHVERFVSTYMEKNAPPEYIEKLMPKYPFGCKRVIVDPGYLASLKRKNVFPTWDGIDEIVAEGIRTKKGELIPLDVIVFATGFDIEHQSPSLTGSEGVSLNKYFESKGGPTAYLGTTVPGFPNFYMLMGPNTATGHASIVFSEEAQINYALHFIKPIIDKKAKSFTVKPSAADAYNDMLQKRLDKCVFTECASWYRAGGTGKNVALFPGPLTLFWWWTLSPRWDDYKATDAVKWKREQHRKKIINVILALLLLAGSVGLSRGGMRSKLWSLFTWLKAKTKHYTVPFVSPSSLLQNRAIV